MKLCKDCKHAVLPNPLAQLRPGYESYMPMCGHPSADRDVVYGSLTVSCVSARGHLAGGLTQESICWPDAKLFEQREPKSEVKPGMVVPINTIPEQSIGFWQRIFGGWFGSGDA
jgi:hypothetical protein